VKRCVAWGARLIVIGFAGGHIPQIELNRTLLKNMAVVGLAWPGASISTVDRGCPKRRSSSSMT
jgi:hypothetical protein